MKRRKRIVAIGKVRIGGTCPVAVQSMTKTKTSDIKRTVAQIKRLVRTGCEIVRLAVVNRADAMALEKIKGSVSVPLVADIHFDHRLALAAIDAGIDKVRINPGNIGDDRKVKEVIRRAQWRGIPVRIGVNSGSLPPAILRKYRHPTPRAIVESVKRSLDVFAGCNFDDIVISAKGAAVLDTVRVYEILHEQFEYPLHIGITEAGLPFRGGIKSAVGLGILLHEHIGDTIRVSLTGDPVKEVVAAYEILSALELRRERPVLISCPTCGRCDLKLEPVARAVEKRLGQYKRFMKIAVMGCVVNGPGEAREADFGIACGRRIGIIFARGKEVKRVRESALVDTLFEVIDENITD
jgi:(E)-4-hydroxy-3-methylbut-2-enyl-diphosphate synthase